MTAPTITIVAIEDDGAPRCQVRRHRFSRPTISMRNLRPFERADFNVVDFWTGA